MRILLIERSTVESAVLTRFKSIFAFRNGIFSELERIRLKNPGAGLFYFHPDSFYEETLSELHGLHPLSKESAEIRKQAANTVANHEITAIESFDLVFDSQKTVPVFESLDTVQEKIESDLSLLDQNEFLKPEKTEITESHPVLVHESVKLMPGIMINAESGPVIIDQNTQVSPFTYIEGPAYIGKDCRIDDARIGGGTILGQSVRAGGEIENCIFGDFTNKHHEGFTGHSILGDWVNLGALTTTSDLKNNYGMIRMQTGEEVFDTGRIKLGSVIGDCTKTAIGTMLNTGTVIDAGCNVFGGQPGKYMPPFSWGISGRRYDLERFISDSRKIFARRNREVTAPLEKLIRHLYKD